MNEKNCKEYIVHLLYNSVIQFKKKKKSVGGRVSQVRFYNRIYFLVIMPLGSKIIYPVTPCEWLS